jgi:hypothetical protein
MTLEVDQAVAQARRVPAVLSTEFPVERDGYFEVLIHRTDAIDLSRAPLPLLEQHNRDRLNIGVVENVRLVGKVLRGDVVLGRSARADELWLDIEAGIVRSLSVAYLVNSYRVVGDVVQVTSWQPFETSLVSVPADPGAGLNRSLTMPQPHVANPASAPAAPATITQPAADTAVQAERTRCAEIRELSIRHEGAGVAQIADAAIREGHSVDAFRRSLLDELARADQAAGGHINRASITVYGQSERNDFIAAASDALLIRSGVRLAKPHPSAADMRGMSVIDLARSCSAKIVGGNAFGSPREVLRIAMTTSDFPLLLSDTLGKALRQGSEDEPATHRLWVALTDANDFRTLSRVILGSAPDLLSVAELGEYTNGSLDEDRNTLIPAKYGRIVELSWESMLADNLGAFVGIGRSMGQAAMRCEADVLYTALISNALAGPNLSDGVALFHTDRSNILSINTGTGKPLTAAALGQARAKLRRQTSVGGGVLNLAPRTLIVPPERETEAEILVASSTVHTGAANAEAATPAWIGALQVIAEPRLANTDVFYLVADSNVIGTGEVAIVGGTGESPHYEELEDKRKDSMSWKVRHAFAAGFTDFRGMVRVTLTAT